MRPLTSYSLRASAVEIFSSRTAVKPDREGYHAASSSASTRSSRASLPAEAGIIRASVPQAIPRRLRHMGRSQKNCAGGTSPSTAAITPPDVALRRRPRHASASKSPQRGADTHLDTLARRRPPSYATPDCGNLVTLNLPGSTKSITSPADQTAMRVATKLNSQSTSVLPPFLYLNVILVAFCPFHLKQPSVILPIAVFLNRAPTIFRDESSATCKLPDDRNRAPGAMTMRLTICVPLSIVADPRCSTP